MEIPITFMAGEMFESFLWVDARELAETEPFKFKHTATKTKGETQIEIHIFLLSLLFFCVLSLRILLLFIHECACVVGFIQQWCFPLASSITKIS